jgi:ubiquitin C-terminal hydrolase
MAMTKASIQDASSSKTQNKTLKSVVTPWKLLILIICSSLVVITIIALIVFKSRDENLQDKKTQVTEPLQKSNLDLFKANLHENSNVVDLISVKEFQQLKKTDLESLKGCVSPKFQELLNQLLLVKMLQEYKSGVTPAISDSHLIFLEQILQDPLKYGLILDEEQKVSLLKFFNAPPLPPQSENKDENDEEKPILFSSYSDLSLLLLQSSELLKGKGLAHLAKERESEIERLKNIATNPNLMDIEYEKYLIDTSNKYDFNHINLDLMFAPNDGPRNIQNPRNLCYINAFFQTYAAIFKYLNIQEYLELNPPNSFFRLLLIIIKEIHKGRSHKPIPGMAVKMAFIKLFAESLTKNPVDIMFSSDSNDQADVTDAFRFFSDETIFKGFAEKFTTLSFWENISFPSQCGHCGKSKPVTEQYLTLNFIMEDVEEYNLPEITEETKSLPPPALSVEYMINRGLHDETGDFSCSICGVKYKTGCRKNILSFSSFPPILGIQINRANYPSELLVKTTKVIIDGKEETFKEDSPKVEIPVAIGENLFLNPDLKTSGQVGSGSEYMLFSVISHSGSRAAGHYIPTVRVGLDKWVECNDQEEAVEVDIVNFRKYLAGTFIQRDSYGGVQVNPFTPYFLFYIRKDLFDEFNYKEQKFKSIVFMISNNLKLPYIVNSDSFNGITLADIEALQSKFTDSKDIFALNFSKTQLTDNSTWESLILCKQIQDKIALHLKNPNLAFSEFREDEKVIFNQFPFEDGKLFFGLNVSRVLYNNLMPFALITPPQPELPANMKVDSSPPEGKKDSDTGV